MPRAEQQFKISIAELPRAALGSIHLTVLRVATEYCLDNLVAVT